MAQSALDQNQQPGAELHARVVPLDIAEARQIGLRWYGIDGQAERLWGERDNNFSLRTAEGAASLLKVLHQGEDPAVTRMQSAVLMHLADVAPEVPVQRVITSLQNTPDCRVPLADGTTRTVRMTSFLEGAPQRTATQTAQLRRNIGATMARLHGALHRYSGPRVDQHITWDMSNAGFIRSLLGFVPTDRAQLRLRDSLDRFEAEVLPARHALPVHLIHGDFNLDNILVDGQDRVAGIIDFGDMVLAPRLFDIAIGASYQMGAVTAPMQAAADFIAGYAALLPLSDAELDHLGTAIRMRLVLRIVIPEWRASLQPEIRTRYTRDVANVWRLLDEMDGWSQADLRAFFATASAGESAQCAAPQAC